MARFFQTRFQGAEVSPTLYGYTKIDIFGCSSRRQAEGVHQEDVSRGSSGQEIWLLQTSGDLVNDAQDVGGEGINRLLKFE